MALAMMNAPRNKKIVEDVKLEKTIAVGDWPPAVVGTWNTTHRASASNAVTGIGMASVSQKTVSYTHLDVYKRQ